ncbi:MAG: LacI family transcriptional regulator [Clostridiales bacterium]|jgi:DNA-binding LacI/PurR family transcriptional regulator|nr:LacI family transcriptional regulator [Clostridiales bacterium]
MKRDKLSIHDIARLANVSAATVSRVINNSDKVKAETRDKVQAIIDENNFKPNELARGLYTKRSKAIGVIMPEISNHFFAKMFMQIEKAAMTHGQSVFLCNTLSDNSLEDYFVAYLSDKQVDGLILLGGRCNESKPNKNYIEFLKKEVLDMPIVTINGRFERYKGMYASVSSDEYSTTCKGVERLLGMGHSKIGFLGGVVGVTSTDIKIKALQKMKSAGGFAAKPSWVVHGGYDYASGAFCMESLLAQKDLPTAIIAVNDEVAAGAINYCVRRGLHVPESFSILGFDDSAIATTTLPAITTFAHRYEEIGNTAVEFLYRMICGDDPSSIESESSWHVVLGMDFIERSSCKRFCTTSV